MNDRYSVAALIQALRNWVSPQQQQPVEGTHAATPQAEAASKMLPEALMPRDAIERQRARLKAMDEQTRD